MRATLALLLVLSCSSRARAEGSTGKECVASHAAGVTASDAGRLSVAKQRFLECADARCPLEVRKECADAVDEVGRAMPSVVFAANDEHGRDLGLTSVLIDGLPVEARGALAIEIEPGTHQAELGLADGRRRTTSFLVRAGEKYRQIAVVFEGPSAVMEAPPAAASPRAAPERALALAFAGASLLAFGAFTYFALDGMADQRKLDRCKPACTERGVNGMRRAYLLADISLGAGLVFAGTSTFFLVQSSSAGGGPRAPARLGVVAQRSF